MPRCIALSECGQAVLRVEYDTSSAGGVAAAVMAEELSNNSSSTNLSSRLCIPSWYRKIRDRNKIEGERVVVEFESRAEEIEFGQAAQDPLKLKRT